MAFVERRHEKREGGKEIISKNSLIIAIDGQTGSGKWALANALSQEYQLPFVNTGTSIRALALLAIEHGIVSTDETNVVGIPVDFSDKIISLYDGLSEKLRIDQPKDGDLTANVYVGDRDMLEALSEYNKQMAIENISSMIAATPEMRMRLYTLWRDAVERLGGAVVVGRKTGVDLFPQAHLKAFLYADPEASASYRVNRKVMATPQIHTESSYVSGRDSRDRANGLLDQPDDALVIDTTHYIQDAVGLENLANIVKFHLESKYIIK